MSIEGPVVLQKYFLRDDYPNFLRVGWYLEDVDGFPRPIVGIKADKVGDQVSKIAVFAKHPRVSLPENRLDTGFVILYTPSAESFLPNVKKLQTHFHLDGRPDLPIDLDLSIDCVGTVLIKPRVESASLMEKGVFKKFRSDHFQVSTNRGELLIPEWTSLEEMGERISSFRFEDHYWANNPNVRKRYNVETGEIEQYPVPTYSVLGLRMLSTLRDK